MSTLAEQVLTPRGGQERLAPFLRRQMRPVGRWLTPFNGTTIALIAASAVILVVRFVWGLGAVTNLSQDFPWGVWKGFNATPVITLPASRTPQCTSRNVDPRFMIAP